MKTVCTNTLTDKPVNTTAAVLANIIKPSAIPPETVEDFMFGLLTKLEIGLMNAYDRWQDEHEYEDINDYAVFVRSTLEACGAKLTKMTKRPFGFQMEWAGIVWQISANSREVKSKGIARVK